MALNSKKVGFIDEKPIYFEFLGLTDVTLREPSAVK